MFQSIDIIIPVYSLKNSQVEQLIGSVWRQNVSAAKCGHIYIVVNPLETHQLQPWMARINSLEIPPFWSITVLHSAVAGVNQARQIGVDASQSEIVIFFDDDVLIEDPLLLNQHLQFHQSHPEIFGCGGAYKTPDHLDVFSKVYLDRQKSWLNEAFLDQNKITVGYLIGGHFSIKRGLLKQASLSFDVNIKFGSSETEFFLQARNKNLKLCLQRWTVTHDLSDSPRRLLHKTYLQGRGKKYIENKGLYFQPIYRATFKSNLFSERLVNWLYDSVFLWGYFSYNHERLQFFKLYLRKAILQFNLQKQKFINYLRSDL